MEAIFFVTMVVKHCSACNHDHHGPYGSYCLFVKAAKEKCAELGAKGKDFPMYLDFSNVDTIEDVEGKSDATGTVLGDSGTKRTNG